MQKLLAFALTAFLALGGACRGGLGPSSDPAGTYLLVSVNGTAPPAPFFSVEIVSGAVDVKSDGTYQVTSTVRGEDSLGEVVTQTSMENGSYTHTGDTLRFTSTGGRLTVADYGGRSLTVEEGGYVLVYRRQ